VQHSINAAINFAFQPKQPVWKVILTPDHFYKLTYQPAPISAWVPPLTPLSPLIKGRMQRETFVVGRAGEGFFEDDSNQTAPTSKQS